jgi:hypothetical protein
MPALTPQAMLDLPWRYAMSLIDEASKANPDAIDKPPKTVKRKIESGERVQSKCGKVYPVWYSDLLRMGNR